MHSALHYNYRHPVHISEHEASLMPGNGRSRESLDILIVEHGFDVYLVRERSEPRAEYQRDLGNKIYPFLKAFVAFLQFLLRCHSGYFLS